ncbi:MAG TPA: Crp/Fnr family transcriptional regulator [Anaerolineales bacterium]|nr:Crp/Fnr family transcriptional regulator [Anaerolineales bacterium]
MPLPETPVIELLRRLPLLADLPEPDLSLLASQTQVDQFEREAVIFYQGDACDRVWLLRQGRVKIVYHEVDGREVILEMISPGEVFGGAVLFLPQHPATAKAMEDSETISFSSDSYTHFLSVHPQVTLKIIRLLGARLHSMMGLQILAGERVERRMAHIILKLANRVGRTEPDGILITIPLSRQDLADMAGTTLETAIRTMSRFRSQGIIETRRGGYLMIADVEMLRQQAQPPQT